MLVGIVLSLFSFVAGAAGAWILSRTWLKKKLEARSDANNAFLAASAKQLRAPLNQIVGALQLLDFQKMGLTPKQEELLGVLNDGSYNMRGALMDVLDILDLQAGRLQIETSKVDFSKAVLQL
ncbi:MAG: hypothetical protein KAH44_01815, partial [Oricola sp.]|nr:hypothetical protein [Oricola sp.]